MSGPGSLGAGRIIENIKSVLPKNKKKVKRKHYHYSDEQKKKNAAIARRLKSIPRERRKSRDLIGFLLVAGIATFMILVMLLVLAMRI